MGKKRFCTTVMVVLCLVGSIFLQNVIEMGPVENVLFTCGCVAIASFLSYSFAEDN